MSRASPANRADLKILTFQEHNVLFSLMASLKLTRDEPFDFG